MTASDWSREIAALTPLIQGRAIELRGTTSGLIQNVMVAQWAETGDTHDFSAQPDGSVDTLVALGGLTAIQDPFSEIFQWRRILREGGTLAVIFDGSGPPQGLLSLLNHLGGFEISQLRPITPGKTWLITGQRRAIAEIRCPLGSFGPRFAALASENTAARAEIYFQFGTILLQTGDPELARRCFQSLIELEPDSAMGLFGLGMAAGTLGDLAGANAFLARANGIEPDNADIQRWLGLVQDRLAAPFAAGARMAHAAIPALPPSIPPVRNRVAIPQSTAAPKAPIGGNPASPAGQPIAGSGLRIQ